LELTQAFEMFDPFCQGLHMAEHHCCRAAASHFMPDAIHIQPVVRQHLAARNILPHPVDENFGSAAWNTPQSGCLEPFEDLAQRRLSDLCEEVNRRRSESTDVDLREMRLDVAQQVFVPLEFLVRMQATLHQNLIAAPANGSSNLSQLQVAFENVTFLV